MKEYKIRIYRDNFNRDRWQTFTISYKESDLCIGIDTASYVPEMNLFAGQILRELRLEMDAYITNDPTYAVILSPYFPAAGTVREPFAVINADDFYGRNGFEVLARFLAGTDGTGQYCMVGYRVGNTLSESGSVSRGVCETDTDGFLTSVTERTEIRRQEGRGIIFRDEQDEYHALAPETPVSMNMWGFTPDYMDFSARLFARFLAERGHELKSEFYIPTVVNEAIRCGAAKVKVLDTDASWFGVTYAADRPGVVEKIRDLVDAGEYPEQLW